MRVMLVNPSRSIIKGSIWKRIDRSLPSLGIAYIASYLRENGVDVRIVDMKPMGFGADDVVREAEEFNPDIIGFTASTVQINPAFQIAEKLKQRFPEKRIVFGGVHPTIFPDDVLKCGNVDMVVRGEGEITMTEIALGKPADSIPGLSFMKRGEIKHNTERLPINDLDSLPMPAYDLLPVKRYRPSLGNYKRMPAMSIITSRGCPGKCTFCCTDTMGKRIRFRSASRIVEEIRHLVDNYGIKEISFYDDTFTAFKKNVRDFCRQIIKENIDITWSCMSRVDFIDQGLLRYMERAGCHQIGYGIESADEQILKNINKNISLEKARDVIRITKEAGIDARAMFMLGNPGETRETIEKTIRFAIELDPDMVIFNITTPLPGTAMFHWAKERGYLKSMDWDDYDLSHPIMELPTVSRNDIMRYYKLAYKRFYMRPSYLIKRLFKIRSFNETKLNIRTFASLAGF